MENSANDDMKITVKAGVKEFVFVLIWIGVIVLASDAVAVLITDPPIVRSLCVIALMCVAVYFVYKKYCARFTFELGAEGLSATEKIGRRERKAYIGYSDITAVSARPTGKNTVREVFTKSIISGKNRIYISCRGGRTVIIEANDKFRAKLEEKING